MQKSKYLSDQEHPSVHELSRVRAQSVIQYDRGGVDNSCLGQVGASKGYRATGSI